MIQNIFRFAIESVLSTTTQVLAQEPAATASAQAAPPSWTSFVPFAVIIGVFYFIIIRPQAKKQKETQSFLAALKAGDQVITQAGILGRIKSLDEQIVTLEIASEVFIKVLRTQVLMSQNALSNTQAKKEGK